MVKCVICAVKFERFCKHFVPCIIRSSFTPHKGLESESRSVVSNSLSPLLEFSKPEYWSGSRSLLQGIFPTQGSKPGFPHCRRIVYQLSHQGSPRILEWRAYPFSRGSSCPRNRTGVSCIAGRFFTAEPSRKPRKRLGHHLTNPSASPSPTFRAQMLNHL